VKQGTTICVHFVHTDQRCSDCAFMNGDAVMDVPASELSRLKEELESAKGKLDEYQLQSVKVIASYQVHKARVQKLVEALRKIDDPMKYHHLEEDAYTRAGCFQFVAHEALKEWESGEK